MTRRGNEAAPATHGSGPPEPRLPHRPPSPTRAPRACTAGLARARQAGRTPPDLPSWHAFTSVASVSTSSRSPSFGGLLVAEGRPRRATAARLPSDADSDLARIPARRHRLERLHALPGARLVGAWPRGCGGLPGTRGRRSTTSGRRPVVRPDIGPVLPVFVRDNYENFEVKLLGRDELGRASACRRGQRSGHARASAGRLHPHEPRPARGSGRRRFRRAVRRQGAWERARVRDPRQCGAATVGEDLAGRRP